jgi:hypothetical protein
MRASRKKLLIVVCGIVGAVALWLLWDNPTDPFDNASFDQALWSKWRGSWDPDSPRGHMASDLIGRLERGQPTRSDVLALLGPPEAPCSKLTPPAGDLGQCLSYSIGSWSGFRMDSDTLDVYFGYDGRVRNAFTVQH